MRLFLVIFGGSVVYWLADGAVGTPEQFRDRVASIGLEVDWLNVGPRAGDGSIDTDCGRAPVTINEIDGDLWVTTAGEPSPDHYHRHRRSDVLSRPVRLTRTSTGPHRICIVDHFGIRLVPRLAEIVQFHHVRGLTPGLVAFADQLRAAGHTAHTPDLFDGRMFDSIEEGLAFVRTIGFEETADLGYKPSRTSHPRSFDQEASALVMQRVLEFLDRI